MVADMLLDAGDVVYVRHEVSNCKQYKLQVTYECKPTAHDLPLLKVAFSAAGRGIFRVCISYRFMSNRIALFAPTTQVVHINIFRNLAFLCMLQY